VTVGLSAAVQLCVAEAAPPSLVGITAALLPGCACDLTLGRANVATPLRLLVQVLAPFMAMLGLSGLVMVPGNAVVAVGFVVGAALGCAASVGQRRRAAWVVVTVPVLTVTGLVSGAGAWSVDEPVPSDPAMVAGNGVAVADDTHAFLIQQGTVILRNDGRIATADFLAAPDPTAPRQRTGSGSNEKSREP
jgi:hypothetical protein